MKRFFLIAFLLLMSLSFTHCTNETIECPTCPTDIDTVYIDTSTTVDEWIEPSIQLQQVEASLAKSLINQYPNGIAMYEIEALMLAKTSGGAIDFSDVHSKKEYFYILVNNGSADIREVQFNTDFIVADPGYISVIQADGVGIGLISIIKIAVPHVVSLDGVGAPPVFEIGDFVDTVHTTYEYTSLQGDTVNAEQDWEVIGTKMGGVFDITFAGESLYGSHQIDQEWFVNEHSQGDAYRSNTVDGTWDMANDTLMFTNTGNVDLVLVIYNDYEESSILWEPVHTQTVWVGSSFNLNEYISLVDGVIGLVNYMEVYTLTSALRFQETTFLDGSLELKIAFGTQN